MTYAVHSPGLTSSSFLRFSSRSHQFFSFSSGGISTVWWVCSSHDFSIEIVRIGEHDHLLMIDDHLEEEPAAAAGVVERGEPGSLERNRRIPRADASTKQASREESSRIVSDEAAQSGTCGLHASMSICGRMWNASASLPS